MALPRSGELFPFGTRQVHTVFQRTREDFKSSMANKISLQACRHAWCEVQYQESYPQSNPRRQCSESLRDNHSAGSSNGLKTSKQPSVGTVVQLEDVADLKSYGVSRVYDQQCTYVLSDAQTAQNNMRALLRVVKSNDLDLSATKSQYMPLSS